MNWTHAHARIIVVLAEKSDYKKVSAFLKRVYERMIPTIEGHLEEELVSSYSVLDLGCGRKSPLQCCKIEWSVGIDLFDASLRESKKREIHSDYIKANVTCLPLKEKTFDAIIALDLLEHLSKVKGYKLIEEMEKLSKKKIIIFTPNGYITQSGDEDNPWQIHKSGWIPEELEKLGFKTYGINGFKLFRGYRASIRHKPKFLWRQISNLSERIVHRNPKNAFQLFCVKILQ